MVETDYQIDADDLLHCAARISGSALSYDLLAGYTDAYQGGEAPASEATREYTQGYYLCNRSALTLGERQVEMLAVISAISELGLAERGLEVARKDRVMVETMQSGAVRKYTSVGGYPICYVGDGFALCPTCAQDLEQTNELNGTEVATVNWEDPDLYCDECAECIESAYAEDGMSLAIEGSWSSATLLSYDPDSL